MNKVEDIDTIEVVFLSKEFTINFDVVDENIVCNLTGYPMGEPAIINGLVCSPDRRYSLKSLEAKLEQMKNCIKRRDY
jgi:hypothetical protein